MIATKEGTLKVFGGVNEVMADLSIIVSGLCKNPLAGLTTEEMKDFIVQAVNNGLMSEEEVKESLRLSAIEQLEEILNILKETGVENGSK